ncbi:hypothetical protein J8I87_17985 [Paraburkholderia sp. LEh10]|jgi:hypothetical protein|uniref:hypothetical protein n=1 Tax=Paraburkholderia sp. LEh10 TaxID=2821353 RepID=UPI001AE958B8|nr:hypothetical protein [Paraburkholderia sp. LEh10]MBP0591582.1 hypothetical protein [Paraburkholderia sp. LEh10]
MSTHALRENSPQSSWLPAGTRLLGGALIASKAGFDIVFNTITGGVPWIRVVLFLALATIGSLSAPRTWAMVRSGRETLSTRVSRVRIVSRDAAGARTN